MVAEMTGRQFLESTWFKLLWRGVIVVGIPALSVVSGYAGYTLNSVYGQQASLTAEVAEIKATQSDRATVNDTFQTAISGDVAAIDGKIEHISAAMAAVQIDVARIAGIVSEMQRRDVAQRLIPPLQ